jgi:hypothetical protein
MKQTPDGTPRGRFALRQCVDEEHVDAFEQPVRFPVGLKTRRRKNEHIGAPIARVWETPDVVAYLHRADLLDEGRERHSLDLAAEPSHMNVHGLGRALVARSPRVADQEVPRDGRPAKAAALEHASAPAAPAKRERKKDH